MSKSNIESKTTSAQSLELAERFFKAVERNDIATFRDVYAPDAKIWHNFDGKTQTVAENVALVESLIAKIDEMLYDDIRRDPIPTGFVQQHVLRGRVKSSGAQFSLPACMVVEVENGHVTNLREYFDSAHFAVLIE